VRIDIPSILVHLRAKQVDSERHGMPGAQDAAMKAAGWVMRSEKRFAAAELAAKAGRLLGGRKQRIASLPFPGSKWTASRDMAVPPKETFRQWWTRTHPKDGS
jgi:L-lactate dehydrogenase complex protein LldF